MAPGPPTNVPGQLTISVRVPYRVVGLVVGPKGATIKRIQQQTQTYIVTPSRDKEPVFEVTGLPESVEAAKKEIESHIAMRTGTLYDDDNHLAAFAATHNLSMDTLMGSPELLNYFRLSQQQAAVAAAAAAVNAQHIQPSSGSLNNGLSSASLNAMLSTNSSQGIGSSFGLGSYNGFGSNNLSNGLTNGHSSGSSLTNGLGNLLNTNLGGLNTGLNNGTFSKQSLSDYNMLLSGGSSGTNSGNNYPNISALTGMNFDMNLGNGGSRNSNTLTSGLLNGLCNGSSTTTNNSQSAGHISDFTGFDFFGDHATSLLNNGPRLNNIDSAAYAGLGGASNFSSVPTMAYGLDEGLGSLESSIGSSPGLDQQNRDSIWGSSGMNMAGFSLPGRNFVSGENSPTHRSHSPARRSNSDSSMPQLSALTAALNNLSTVGPLRRSSINSPEIMDLTSKINSLATSVCSSVLQPADTDVATSAVAQCMKSSPITTASSSSDAVSTTTGKMNPGCVEILKLCSKCKSSRPAVVMENSAHQQLCLPCSKKIDEPKAKVEELVEID